MKYRENMTQAERDAFMRELNALDAAYASAAAHDAAQQAANPAPDEWEDQSDYVGMGWIGKDGRP